MKTLTDLIASGDVVQVTADGNPLVTFAWKGAPIPEGQHPPACKPPDKRRFAGMESCDGWYRNGVEWRIDCIDPVALKLEG